MGAAMHLGLNVIFGLLGLFWVTSLHAERLPLATCNLPSDEICDFHEEVVPAARISGNLVTGFQDGNGLEAEFKLLAFIPDSWSGETICTRVVSSDGRYLSANEYVVPDQVQSSILELQYPTRHPDRFTKTHNRTLSVRVSRSGCDVEGQETTVAFWNIARLNKPTLLINSFQAEAVFIYINDAPMPIRCAAIDLDGLSAYDTECSFEDVEVIGQANIEILRVVKGKAAPPTQLKIWLPEN